MARDIVLKSNGDTAIPMLLEQVPEWQKQRRCVLSMLDFVIAEGKLMKAWDFVHYLEMAKLEFEHFDPTKMQRRLA